MSTEAYKDLSKDELVVELVKMHHELDQLKRLVFGSRQERFIPSAPPEQLGLGLATSATAPVVQSIQAISYTRKAPEVSSEKVSTGRMKLPASLPREEVVIEPTEDVTGWNKIGQEVTEELERIPASCSFAGMYALNTLGQMAKVLSSHNFLHVQSTKASQALVY